MVQERIDKSISLGAVGSFPAYRFFMRGAGCTMQGWRRGGFHQEIARTGRKRQNQRSGGKRRNEFPPRSEKRLMT